MIVGKNMAYNHLLHKYEQWGDVIPAGTTNICTVPVREHFTNAKTRIVDGFFGDKRAMLPPPEFDVAFFYRDVMTVPKITPLVRWHNIMCDVSFYKLKELFEMGITEIGGGNTH